MTVIRNTSGKYSGKRNRGGFTRVKRGGRHGREGRTGVSSLAASRKVTLQI